MDKITLSRIETAHPAVRQQLLTIYEEICSRLTGRAQCRFTEVIRSSVRQEELYAQGRTKPGRKLSNELLRQGMILSGEVSKFRANLVYHAVQNFGTYYNMDDALPEPYTINRTFEKILWRDR